MLDGHGNELGSKSSSPPPTSITRWFLLIVLAAAGGLSLGLLLRGLTNPPVPQHPLVGKPVPEIVAEGWMNGEEPQAADLAGQVYVIEAWAHWCSPCLAVAPHTIELYEQYHDRGVKFLGLTSMPGTDREKSLKFLQQAKIPWPNGDGAAETLLKLYAGEETPIPFAWVVNRQGKIAWAGHPLALKGEVLERLLSQ